MRVLQREPGRTVVIEDDPRIVRKTFHGEDSVELCRLATSEYERARQFSDALAGIDHAACAKPIELGTGSEPYIRMERARGIPMQDDLDTFTWESDRFVRVAEILRQALIRYVETFNEPYWDFILRNMFYDRATETVTFLDFALPALYLPAVDELARRSPMEVSLGGLVASSVFEATRPTRIFRRREHRQAPLLARSVLRRCLADPAGMRLDAAGVRRVALVTYRLASGGGWWLRQAWYRSYGATVRPIRKLDALCG